MKAGLDISINGSGIAFENGDFYFQTKLVKLPKKIMQENITGFTIADRNDGVGLKYKIDAEDILKECLNRGVTEVALEGYAYGYSGGNSAGMTFDLGEFTGIVKYLLLTNNIKMTLIPPKKIKKFFTGNGNASKVLMVEEYFKKCPNSVLLPLIEEHQLNKYKSPINDLIDAYGLLQMIV